VRLQAVVAGLFAICVCIEACYYPDANRIPGCREALANLFPRPPAVRESLFAALPVERQYNVFLCGTHAVEPPLLGFADILARSGQPVASLLVGKLDSMPDDAVVADITLIVEAMNRQHSYAVSSDTSLMRAVNRAINAMRDSTWRRVAMRNFREVQQ